LLNPDADDSCGVVWNPDQEYNWFECEFGTLPVTPFEGGKVVLLTAHPSLNDCGGTVTNHVHSSTPDGPQSVTSIDAIAVSPECASVELTPDAGVIALSGPVNAPSASPSSITWTIRWTVPLWADPIVGARLSVRLPPGMNFTAASDGGQFNDDPELGPPAVEWPLPETHAGHVTLRTALDPTALHIGPITATAALSEVHASYDQYWISDMATIEAVAATPGATPAASPAPPAPAASSGSLPDTATATPPAGDCEARR
jgi:hypothetical protein